MASKSTAGASTSAERFYGTGRRKTSVARVWLNPEGTGVFSVNGRPYDQYFGRYHNCATLLQPLTALELEQKVDVQVNVAGGGQSGQAEAIRHGLSRALVEYNNEHRGALKHAGFLRRDSRIKERKKYGQPGARKRYQFSKR